MQVRHFAGLEGHEAGAAIARAPARVNRRAVPLGEVEEIAGIGFPRKLFPRAAEFNFETSGRRRAGVSAASGRGRIVRRALSRPRCRRRSGDRENGSRRVHPSRA